MKQLKAKESLDKNNCTQLLTVHII